MVEVTSDSLYSPKSELGPYRASDYWKLPDEARFELVHGRFFVSSSPSLVHQVATQVLSEILRKCARQSGGIAVIAPFDVVLSEHSVVQPDVLFVEAARR